MTNNSADRALDELIEQLIRSGASEEERIKENAPADPELAGLLALAARIRQDLRAEGPSPEFARNAEIRILNQLKSRRRASDLSMLHRPERRGWLPIPRFATALIAGLLIVAFVLTGAVGTAAAAANALPGDGLYGVKLGLEQARLALTFNPQDDLNLLEDYADERLEEIEALQAAGRYSDLDRALAAYLDALEQYQAANADFDPEGAAEEIDEKLLRHLEVLQQVRDRVPESAQPAIEQVIQAQLETAIMRQVREQERLEEQETRAEEREAAQETREAERNQRTAEQIARQFNVTSAEVLAVFEGQCELEWKCVREHYRELEGRGGGKP